MNRTGVTLKAVYVNRQTGHRLLPFHVDVRAGVVTARVQCHNLTTGWNESFSPRLFLADHDKERNVGA